MKYYTYICIYTIHIIHVDTCYVPTYLLYQFYLYHVEIEYIVGTYTLYN